MSVEQSEKEHQIRNLRSKYLPYGENLVKIGQVYPQIICFKRFIFLKWGAARRRPSLTQQLLDQVHQIYKQYSYIIRDELFKIRMAIMLSVSECQGNE